MPRQPSTPSLAALRPLRKDRVIDLVRAAGLDVSDWSNSRRGEAGAATNPKYCYEWVFVEPGAAIVLNLWHVLLEEQADGCIVHRGNFREDAETQFARGRGSPWGVRARRLDAALQTALQDNLAVRVILNAGVRRDRDDAEAEASKVELRALDPEPWSIAAYDVATGAHVLVRGAAAPSFVDQFSIDADIGGPAVRHEQTGFVFDRDPKVREAVLKRACGRCEYCDQPGFRRADGAVYLETHHIVPLHEGESDRVDNVIALCPNDHREAHYGEDAASLRLRFIAIVAEA
ncbi:HNH endonuclease signature motif containing protein [Sphingobium sp. AP49]|uniref:HNH endonuclease n=1 Tax=Sphingobium sp. AP49 TaxID=1144307 RepID=UPI00026ECA90|nr:HNH endonuclease signature motif containing protein [Sphingobium sp. AP49]WHO37804.1 HNH endonuclease signature motif containing protein [Sphingobium sp. AP49]